MHKTTLAGRETSRIGMGCGRLVGGSGASISRRLIETAYDLGIRHFDTAPSYGLGTSENVLGDVFQGDNSVTVITKVGISRPSSPGLRTFARQIARPLLAATPGLKAKLARQASVGQLRGQFAPEQMRASLAESLRRLRREDVDGILLHQPEIDELTPETTATLAELVYEGQARAFGSSTGGDHAALVPMGTIAQFRAGVGAAVENDNVILHGALRRWRAPADVARKETILRSVGRDPADPNAWVGMLLSYVLAVNPGTVLLLSAGTPERLRSAVGSIDWDDVAECDAGKLATIAAALAVL